MTTALRVVHLLNEVREIGNGITNTAIDLAWGEVRAGLEVHIVSGGGEFESRLAGWGIRHHRLDQRRRPLTLARALVGWRALVRELDPDIVHAHVMTGVVLARMGRAVPYHLVGHVHNVYQRSAALMGLADTVLCCGTQVAETMAAKGVPRGRLAVVLNGTIGSPRLAVAPPEVRSLGPLAIVTVAGMNARKGISELIEAFHRLARAHPAATLHLVGDGPERARFEGEARATGLGDRIVFHGFQRDPRPFLSGAAIFVLASRRESFPIVLGEARAAGCAIVATSVDGVPEALDEGEAGLLVPARDPAGLARALDALLGDPTERAKWAAAAVHGVERFRVERMARETIALYERALVSGKR